MSSSQNSIDGTVAVVGGGVVGCFLAYRLASMGVAVVLLEQEAANFPVSQQVLRSSGVWAVYSAGSGQGPTVPLKFKSTNVTVRMVLVYDMPEPAKAAAIDDITKWLEHGKLTNFEGPHFLLEQLKHAHLAVEGGAVGKVIVDISPGPGPNNVLHAKSG